MQRNLKALTKRIIPKESRRRLRESQPYLRGLLPRLLSWPARNLVRDPEDVFPFVFESMPHTPENIVRSYLQGMFPMPGGSSHAMRFYDPDPRAAIPIDDFHVQSRLKRIVKQRQFEIRVDTDYRGTLLGCAERESTWISPEMVDIEVELHKMGITHSVEAWQDDQLVGGLIGVALGGYFTTESLFHRVTNASRVAMVHLLSMLREGGFVLHDVQWVTQFNQQFGADGIPRSEFKKHLALAVVKPAAFPAPGVAQPWSEKSDTSV